MPVAPAYAGVVVSPSPLLETESPATLYASALMHPASPVTPVTLKRADVYLTLTSVANYLTITAVKVASLSATDGFDW